MSKPKTAANGEGSVYTTTVHGKQVWRAAHSVPYIGFEDGEAVRKVKRITATGGSRSEALARRQALLERFTAQQQGLTAPIPARSVKLFTISELFDQWLAWKRSLPIGDDDYCSFGVLMRYERTIDLHVKPAIGALPAQEVTRQVLRTFLLDTLGEKKKPDGSPLLGRSPLRTIRYILSMAFTWAVAEEMLPANPAALLPKFAKVKGQNLRLEQKRWYVQRMLATVAGTPDEAHWVLAMTTGIRQAERLGLAYDCFTNLNGKDKKHPCRMEIRQQLWRNPVNGRMEIKPDTKTSAGERIIPLPERVRKVLWEHKLRQDEWKKDPAWNPRPGMENLVFTFPDGRPYTHQRDNKMFHVLFDKAINVDDETKLLRTTDDEKYVPHARQHHFRHWVISSMVETPGTSIEVIRTLAGHADIELNRAVYQHLSWTLGVDPMNGVADIMYREVDRKKK